MEVGISFRALKNIFSEMLVFIASWILKWFLCVSYPKGVTIVKPIVYGNVARYFGKKREEDGHTHQWTVYVKPYRNEVSKKKSTQICKHTSLNLFLFWYAWLWGWNLLSLLLPWAEGHFLKWKWKFCLHLPWSFLPSGLGLGQSLCLR